MALPTPLPKYRQIYLQPPRFVLVTPTAAKTQKQQTNVGGWVFGVAGGNWGRLGAPQQHRQPPVEPPTPDSTDLKTSAKLGVTSTSSRSSFVGIPDLRTSWTPQRNKDLCNILQGASVTLHIILLGVGGTIYNTHTLKPFKELGLDSQRVKKLASKLHVNSVNFAAKLVHTRCALSSTVINSHQEPVSGQACNPPDPHWFFLSFPQWTMCVSPPFFRVFGVSFHPPGFLLRLLSCAPSTLYSTWFFFLFPGFLSLVLGLLEQLPFAFSSAWALSPLFFVVCQVPAGGRSCNTTPKKKRNRLLMTVDSSTGNILYRPVWQRSWQNVQASLAL